jgi:hypothetical protein
MARLGSLLLSDIQLRELAWESVRAGPYNAQPIDSGDVAARSEDLAYEWLAMYIEWYSLVLWTDYRKGVIGRELFAVLGHDARSGSISFRARLSAGTSAAAAKGKRKQGSSDSEGGDSDGGAAAAAAGGTVRGRSKRGRAAAAAALDDGADDGDEVDDAGGDDGTGNIIDDVDDAGAGTQTRSGRRTGRRRGRYS